ncbi:MAG: hypothetical protein H6746_20635 [Deltaproteobacteria bacterium]|nr:hypothetical protein [Deltaproteobacteria bacterium]
MRHLTAMQVAVVIAGSVALASCFGTDEDKGFVDPYAHSYLIHRNIDLYADFVLTASDNPGFGSERIIFTATDAPNDDLFWNLDVVETGPETREISLSVDWQDGGGCYFSGLSNPFQGELSEGSCVIPTATGHVYFQLEKAARYQTGNTFGVGTTLLEGRWMELRSGYLLTGEATLYARQHDQNSAIGQTGHAAPPAVATYQDPFEQGGTCVHAGISGTGTLVEGEASVCNSALEYQGDGFDLYIDDGGRLSFVPLDQNQPDQRIQGVVAADGQSIAAFTGNQAGLGTRYDLDFAADTVSFSNSFLWTPETVTSQCTVLWQGKLTACK